MNSVSENGSDFIHDLGDAVRKNPLSAALIGMGVLWLFTGSRPMERASDFVRSHPRYGRRCYGSSSLGTEIHHRCRRRTSGVSEERRERWRGGYSQ